MVSERYALRYAPSLDGDGGFARRFMARRFLLRLFAALMRKCKEEESALLSPAEKRQ